jgi:hypothetical protein
MPLSLESRFLLESLRISIGGGAGSLNLDAGGQLDSERLLSAAHFHRVAPLAYKTLSQLNPKHFPAPIVEHFRRDVNAIALRSLQLTAEMLRLLRLLEAEGIPTVAFKGPVLSLQAYGDPFLRQFDDIDLLVPLPEFDRTRSFLVSHGYTDNGVLTHACNLVHYQRRTAVDLHRWVLGPLGFSGSTWVTMDSESLLARSVDLTFQEHRIRTFQTEDLLLALSIHGAKHAWERWIWLFDIAALIARNPLLDWDQLTKRSQEYAITEPVYLSLRLTETVCGRALPPGALKGLGVRPAVEKLIPALNSAIVQDPDVLRSNLRKYLLPFQTLTKGSDKCHYLLRLLKRRITPTGADHSAINLPPYLEFIYFAIRPLRLLYKYGSNMAGYVTLRLRWNRNPENRHK